MKRAGGGAGGDDLLGTIPLGGLLMGMLRLAVPADRREEFLGDLIEEARWRRSRAPAATDGDTAAWLWTQVLRSLPNLLGLRLRGLIAGGWVSPTPARPGAGVLVAARGSHRGWPLPLATSVAAHALAVAVVVTWLFARVEEVEPVGPVLDTLAAMITDSGAAEDPPATATAAMIADSGAPSPLRRGRTPRRSLPVASPKPAAGPQPGTALPGAASPGTITALAAQAPEIDRGAGEAAGPVALPPRIAEKRCLTCPTPQLPPAYAHLARGQDMVIRTCVSAAGEVTSVNVLRGFDRTVNREVLATVRHWRMVPYQLNGHPVPFCYSTRFLFTSP